LSANDPLKMCKLLVVQCYSNVSDEQTEYQVSDLPVRSRIFLCQASGGRLK